MHRNICIIEEYANLYLTLIFHVLTFNGHAVNDMVWLFILRKPFYKEFMKCSPA